MASSVVPGANTRNGFTIVTQVVPAGMDQYGPGTGGGDVTGGPVKKPLKGEPKALGTVQIMIGIMTLFFGIVKTVYSPHVGVYSGVTYWGSCLFYSDLITTEKLFFLFFFYVRSSLVMNIISAVAAGIAMVLLSFDIALQEIYGYYSCSYDNRWSDHGISGVLLVFSLFEFIISICSSAFICKATCCNESPVSETKRFVYNNCNYT
uniref:Uncharacterized protein n=1 Tax=Pygocentrus nattereri TaxID=42514 RepID=A0AAR2L4R5_PYGNA